MHLEALASEGLFDPGRIAAALRTTREEVAGSVGLGRDALSRRDRVRSARTQSRLRQMVEILNRVEPRFGSALLAYAWYRSTPLPGFDGQTPMHLVKAGDGEAVHAYLDALDAGIHA